MWPVIVLRRMGEDSYTPDCDCYDCIPCVGCDTCISPSRYPAVCGSCAFQYWGRYDYTMRGSFVDVELREAGYGMHIGNVGLYGGKYAWCNYCKYDCFKCGTLGHGYKAGNSVWQTKVAKDVENREYCNGCRTFGHDCFGHGGWE